MDSQELPALAQNGVKPRFVFEGRDDHESYPSRPAPLSYGITSAPLPAGPSACPIFQFFNWPPGVAAFSGVYMPLVTTPGDTPDVDTPESYTGTERVRLDPADDHLAPPGGLDPAGRPPAGARAAASGPSPVHPGPDTRGGSWLCHRPLHVVLRCHSGPAARQPRHAVQNATRGAVNCG